VGLSFDVCHATTVKPGKMIRTESYVLRFGSSGRYLDLLR
jgi:hypothetical protein